MDLTIEKAQAEDAAELLAFLKQVGAETDHLTFGGEGVPFTVEEEADFIRSQSDNPLSIMYVAKGDGKILGNCSFSASPRARLRHRGELSIAVAREAWGMGIGTKLMEAAISFARNTAQVEILHLEVRRDNLRAIRLYEKFGFQKIGTFPGFLKIDGKWVDFDLMNLYL